MLAIAAAPNKNTSWVEAARHNATTSNKHVTTAFHKVHSKKVSNTECKVHREVHQTVTKASKQVSLRFHLGRNDTKQYNYYSRS